MNSTTKQTLPRVVLIELANYLHSSDINIDDTMHDMAIGKSTEEIVRSLSTTVTVNKDEASIDDGTMNQTDNIHEISTEDEVDSNDDISAFV